MDGDEPEAASASRREFVRRAAVAGAIAAAGFATGSGTINNLVSGAGQRPGPTPDQTGSSAPGGGGGLSGTYLALSAVSNRPSGTPTGGMWLGTDLEFKEYDGTRDLLVRSPGVRPESFGATGNGTTDDAPAIQAAINSSTNGQVVVFSPDKTYLIKSGLTVSKLVSLRLAPSTVLKAGTAGIAMITFNKVTTGRGFGLLGGQLDMNNLAAVGLLLQDTWFSEIDSQVVNPGGGTGLKLLSTLDSFLSLYNDIRVDLRGSAKATGSIGIDIETTAPTGRTCFNRISGRAGAWDTGVKVGGGDQNIFHHFDSSDNNTGYDMSGAGNVLDLAFCELNATDGVVVRTGAYATVLPAYVDKIRSEGTGMFVLLNGQFTEFHSTYPTATPNLKWFQTGDSSSSLRYNVATWTFHDDDNNVDAFALNRRAREFQVLDTTGTQKAGLLPGSAGSRGVLKLWDAGAAGFRYVYVNNGALVIASSLPT